MAEKIQYWKVAGGTVSGLIVLAVIIWGIIWTASTPTDMIQKDSEGNTALHLAAEQGNEAAVRELIHRGDDVNSKNNEEQTPLHKAAARAKLTCGKETVPACLAIINFLVKNGAKIDAQDNDGKIFLHTLLGYYTTVTSAELQQIALEYDHLFSVPENYGRTVLHMALERVKVEISTLSLLHKGAVDFKAVDFWGRTLLFYAVEGHQSEAVLSKLLEFGADYKRLDTRTQSLLHIAAEYGHADALELFIGKKGMNINGTDEVGWTALHHVGLLSRYSNMLKVTRLLIDNAASKTIKDNIGKTPYDVVTGRDFPDKDKVLELLR